MKRVINIPFFIVITMLLLYAACKKNNPVPAPVVSAISPTSGVAGTSVTVSGSNFAASAAGNTVSFNGTAATVTSASVSTLVVTAPVGGGTGQITVTTTGGTATGPVFTYLQGPTISALSPVSGVAGSSVNITGTNFDAIAANNTVKFNGTATTVTSATTTSLVVKAPVGGSTGAVTVTTTVGTATGPVFTYLQAPAITTINPATAAAGTSVTITGTNFDATIANDVVKFNGTIATVTAASATQLTVTVPAGGSSGNVTVTTLSGTSNGVPFTYASAGGPNIYVVGSDTQYGYGYWTNSTFTHITNITNPYAMVGSGPDLYIAGPATSNTPTYWKNSTPVQLSSQTGYTFSICLSGPDIYCLGNIGGSYYVWKNGVASKLSTTSIANIGGSGTSSYLGNAIAVDNGNVYVAGSQQFSNTTISKATYWKNGTPIDLTDGITSGSAWATAVYISGVDVYVAGFEAITASNGGVINKAPRLWKNGVLVSLATPGNSLFNSVSCILVSGNNVYVGGQYNGAAAVWQNGVMINVATYALAEQISSMFLYNNTDLYITGASSASGNNCYWKNGNFVEMDPGCHGLSSNCANTSANQAISIYVH